MSDSYIDTWEEYWLSFAFAACRKSKDPRCRVGAVIVRDNVMLSTGFNGLARHLYDDPAVLAEPEEKLKWICHAEQNAIHNAARLGIGLEGATIYVTKFPCLACCNAIVQVGIATIYTHDHRFWDDDPFDPEHARKRLLLRQAGIKVTAPFHPEYAPRPMTNKSMVPLAPAAQAPKSKRGKSEQQKQTPNAKRRGKAVGPGQKSLFPARQVVRGGRS